MAPDCAANYRANLRNGTLGTDVDHNPGRGNRRKSQRVPVGEMYAALCLRAADLGRLGSAVDAVVRFAEPHPEHSDRIVRAGGDIDFHVISLGSVNEHW